MWTAIAIYLILGFIVLMIRSRQVLNAMGKDDSAEIGVICRRSTITLLGWPYFLYRMVKREQARDE